MGIILGHTDATGYGQTVGLADDDRRHHVYAIGQTGTGKSTFLHNALVQDLEAGRGDLATLAAFSTRFSAAGAAAAGRRFTAATI